MTRGCSRVRTGKEEMRVPLIDHKNLLIKWVLIKDITMSIHFCFSARFLVGVWPISATVFIRCGKVSVTYEWIYPLYTMVVFIGLVPTILALYLTSLLSSPIQVHLHERQN